MKSKSQPSRSAVLLGWEAAKANALPALIIQLLMLALLVGYYVNPTVARLLEQFAAFKHAHGFGFVLIASIVAGAIVPEIFLIVFFQRGRFARSNIRNLMFTIPVWGFDGSLVDILYRTQAHWFGDVATIPVIVSKICV